MFGPDSCCLRCAEPPQSSGDRASPSARCLVLAVVVRARCWGNLTPALRARRNPLKGVFGARWVGRSALRDDPATPHLSRGSARRHCRINGWKGRSPRTLLSDSAFRRIRQLQVPASAERGPTLSRTTHLAGRRLVMQPESVVAASGRTNHPGRSPTVPSLHPTRSAPRRQPTRAGPLTCASPLLTTMRS